MSEEGKKERKKTKKGYESAKKGKKKEKKTKKGYY